MIIIGFGGGTEDPELGVEKSEEKLDEPPKPNFVGLVFEIGSVSSAKTNDTVIRSAKQIKKAKVG